MSVICLELYVIKSKDRRIRNVLEHRVAKVEAGIALNLGRVVGWDNLHLEGL